MTNESRTTARRTRRRTRTSSDDRMATRRARRARDARRDEARTRPRLAWPRRTRCTSAARSCAPSRGGTSRSKAAAERARRRPRACVNVPRGSRKDARDAVLAAKNALARLGGADGVQPRADPLSPRRGDGVAPRASSATSLVRGGRRARPTRDGEVDASIDRAVFYAGFCDKYQALVASSQPGRGPALRLQRARADGRRRRRRAGAPALLGPRLDRAPGHRGGQHVRRAREREPIRGRRSCSASASRRAICPAASSTCSPARRTRSRRTSRSTARSSASTRGPTTPTLREALERDGADNVKRVKTHAPQGPSLLARRREGRGSAGSSGSSRRRRSGTPSGSESDLDRVDVDVVVRHLGFARAAKDRAFSPWHQVAGIWLGSRVARASRHRLASATSLRGGDPAACLNASIWARASFRLKWARSGAGRPRTWYARPTSAPCAFANS